MKKIIKVLTLFLLFLNFSFLTFADTSNPWNIQINVGNNNPVGKIKMSNGDLTAYRESKSHPLFIGVNGYYKLSDSQWIGIGSTLEGVHNQREISNINYDRIMGNLPVYAIYRVNIENSTIFIPYVEARLGADFAHAPSFGSTYNPGLYYGIGIGTTFKNYQFGRINLSNVNFEILLEDGSVHATNNGQEGTTSNYMRYGVSLGYNFNI